ncbi:MAG: hypothetical protein U0Q21_05660 [Dermatophilaceae bacterium]
MRLEKLADVLDGVTTLPKVVADFVPKSVTAGTNGFTVSGTVPVLDALYVVGLQPMILNDPELVKNLEGAWPATLDVSPLGDIRRLDLTQGPGDVTGFSATMSASSFHQVVAASRGSLSINGRNAASVFTVPTESMIFTGS